MPHSMYLGKSRQDWETPGWLFQLLDEEFAFDVDVCATEDNTKVSQYFDPEVNGLSQDWAGLTCWMNPPYGRGLINQWLRKAVESVALHPGTTVVALIPFDPSTAWWHEYAMQAHTLRLIQGRVRFVGAGGSPHFSVCVAVFQNPRPTIPALRSWIRVAYSHNEPVVTRFSYQRDLFEGGRYVAQ